MNRKEIYRKGALKIVSLLKGPENETLLKKVISIIKRCAEGNFAHGTISGYIKFGCRCVPCCTASREYHKAYRKRTKGFTL